MVEVRAGNEAIRAVQPQIDAALAEVAKARPEIEKAVAEAQVGAQAARDAQPQIDAAMAEVAKARPEIDKAIAAAQPQIDAALEKVRAELAKDHLDTNVQVRVDAALKRAEIRIEAIKAQEHGAAHEERKEERTEERTTTDAPGND
jgi:ABC-type transporter Mla subunit MlaD